MNRKKKSNTTTATASPADQPPAAAAAPPSESTPTLDLADTQAVAQLLSQGATAEKIAASSGSSLDDAKHRIAAVKAAYRAASNSR